MRIEGKAANVLPVIVVIALAAATAPPAARAFSGGITPTPNSESTPTPPAGEAACPEEGGGFANTSCARVAAARLVRGRAVAPAGSPRAVRRVIRAANRIRTRPYIWGGGHAHWWSRGYDCSGAVGFALHGGDLLETPLTSGGMMRWGAPGKGRWITIYTNRRHAYAVIDGLRWDTVGDRHGTGPRWHSKMVSPAGFVARHPIGY